MAKYTKKEEKFLKEMLENVDLPIPIKHYNLPPGTKLDISSLKGLNSFEMPQTKNIARRNLEYVEVVKEYYSYILVRVHTSVPINTVHTGTTQYFTYTEAISKYALTVNDNAYIKVLE